MTACPLAADRVTVNVSVLVAALPSTTATSAIDSVGVGSLSTMLPWPCASSRLELAELPLRLTNTVSVGSSSRSARIGTVMVLLVSPGAKVSAPLTAVKSTPAVAVPAVELA